MATTIAEVPKPTRLLGKLFATPSCENAASYISSSEAFCPFLRRQQTNS
jgi:hypothetical protein